MKSFMFPIKICKIPAVLKILSRPRGDKKQLGSNFLCEYSKCTTHNMSCDIPVKLIFDAFSRPEEN